MTSRPKILSEDFVRDVATEGRYGDGRGGNGLSLLVKKMRMADCQNPGASGFH